MHTDALTCSTLLGNVLQFARQPQHHDASIISFGCQVVAMHILHQRAWRERPLGASNFVGPAPYLKLAVCCFEQCLQIVRAIVRPEVALA